MKNYFYIVPGGGIFSRILQFGIIHLAYIDFDNVTLDDIYVIGKIVEIDLNTEDYFDLTTENDENIIL
jgi:hypothetical protein